MSPNPSDILPSQPAYDIHAHYGRVLALYKQYPIKTEEAAEAHAIDIVKRAIKNSGRKGTLDFLNALVSTIQVLFEEDHLYWSKEPGYVDLAQTEKLLSVRRLEVAAKACVEILSALIQVFPEEALDFVDPGEGVTPINSEPLISLCPRPITIVDALCAALVSPTVPGTKDDDPVFPHTRAQILENISLANNILPDAPLKEGKRIKLPKDFDLDPPEAVSKFLHETPFTFLLTLPIVKKMPEMPQLTDSVKFEHTWCLAGAGAGKTTLILKEIVDNLRHDNPPAMVILDPKGTITSQVSRLAVFAGKHAGRLIIVDPTDVTAPPAVNMFHPGNVNRYRMYSEAQRRQVENRTIDLFSYVFASRKNALTPQQSTCFNFLVRLLFSIEGANIHTMLDLINDQLYSKQASIDKSPWKAYIDRQLPLARRWFADQYYSHLVETRKGIATRLYGLLEKPELEAVFSARDRKLDMFDALQTGKTVLIKIPKALLGQEGMELFGRYIIALSLASAFERVTIEDRSRWHPAFLYIDEFQEFADEEKSAELFQLAREFNLGVFAAHQDITSQLSESLRSALSTNTTIKYVSALGGLDANYMAREMNCDADFFRQAVKTASHARFAAYVRGATPHPVIVEVPLGAIENEPRMTNEQYGDLLSRNRASLTENRPDHTIGNSPLAMKTDDIPASPTPQRTSSQTQDDPQAPTSKSPAERMKSRPTAESVDPHEGEHTEPASKWGDKK